MNERLLQYIWQFQYFDSKNLQTTSGEAIKIITPGIHNTNQGPDFLQARIKTGREILAGNVELHLLSSDWHLHKHSTDKHYSNVILHVVYQQNEDAHHSFPTLELKGRISRLMLSWYEELMQQQAFIPCANAINTVNEITILSTKDRMLAERLISKAENILELLKKNSRHWEETFWVLLARNFGVTTNADSFLEIAKSIPVNILSKIKSNIIQLEALLLGQAELLNKDFTEDYPALLKKEYAFLAKKYALTPPAIQINFSRMRPANFPTIRLAQLAAVIQKNTHLFSKILEADELMVVLDLLYAEPNDYWNYHYVFDEETGFKRKPIGKSMLHSLVINTIAPMIFSYGQIQKNEKQKQKAIHWLEQLPAEGNTIIRGFKNIGIPCRHAADSQALLHLKKYYCDPRNCLQCSIGNAILKKSA